MKKNKLLGLILVAILVIIGTIFVFYQKPSETKVVKIGYLPIMASLPLYVAQENEYFSGQGIQIETIQMQSSNQLVDALVRGDIDVVVESSAASALIAETIDSGKIKIFSASDITPETPFDSLIIKKDSSLTSLKDLEGKKIGVFPGNTATNLLKKYLSDNGVDIAKMEFIQIIPANQLPALYAGSIDALHAYEPTTAIALQSGNAKKLYSSIYAEQLNHNPQGVALISAKFVSENSRLAKRTVAAFNQASDFISKNDAKTREIVVKYVKVNKSVSDNVVFLYMGRSDKINKDALQAYADMLNTIGEMENKINISNLLYNP